jgi:GT2 family glycosyltransferase
MPLVSVLTTSFNRENYIAQAIDSVLNSSFSDFEYIIVDDSSTDGTVEIIRSYAERDPRIRFFVNEKNLGDYNNRNKAASFAIGKYIKYVDSDDIIYPHGLGVMAEIMERHPDVALGLSRPPSGQSPYPTVLKPAESYRRHFLEDGVLSSGPLSAIINRSCFERLGGFSGKRFIGDNELWLLIARHYPVLILPDGLTWYRRHSAQEWTIAGVMQSIAYFSIASEALNHSQCPLPPVNRQTAIERLRIDHAKSVLLSLRHGRVNDAKAMAAQVPFNLSIYGYALTALFFKAR